MPASTGVATPGLPAFLKSLKSTPSETAIEHLISLLKRRQIRSSRPCAIATAQLLLRVVADFKGRDVPTLLERIRSVGNRLTAAQPREMAVGNIVRRVLGLVREVDEEREEQEDASEAGDGASGAEMSTHASEHQHSQLDSLHRPPLSSTISAFSPLKRSGAEPFGAMLQQTDRGPAASPSETGSLAGSAEQLRRPPLQTQTSVAPTGTSLFSLFSHPGTPSPSQTPRGSQTPTSRSGVTTQNLASFVSDPPTGKQAGVLKNEVIEGIREVLDELDQVDDQIAAYALEHIHSSEIILTYTASTTVQKFLLTAAKKRTFTVIHAEAYPNDHADTHATILHGQRKKAATSTGTGADAHGEDGGDDNRFKPLTSAGITVVVIPDSAVFAVMSRVNKVILATHTVLANGGLVAAAGARTIATAAKTHQTPVVVVSGVYKLSPLYPFDVDELIEHGDAGMVVPYEDGEFVDKVDVVNPLFDYVPPELVDLYITNLGGHAPSYLYRIVADHYREEDINFAEADLET